MPRLNLRHASHTPRVNGHVDAFTVDPLAAS